MMTPHAQNIALAKLDGWKPQAYGHNLLAAHMAGDFQYFKNGVACAKRDLPRYTESLDALRPILLKLTLSQGVEYYSYLAETIYGRRYEGEIVPVRLLVASAAQVAEAILRTVGKYS